MCQLAGKFAVLSLIVSKNYPLATKSSSSITERNYSRMANALRAICIAKV
jgi:hypothetical protein